MSLPFIYAAALVVALLLAVAKGSREAVLVAAGYTAAQVLTMAADPGRWSDLQLGLFAIDLLLLGWLLWIIVRTSLLWPIALGVLQMLTVLGHLARLSTLSMEKMGYFVLLQWTAWPAFLVIVVGVVLDWRAGRTSRASWKEHGSTPRRAKRNI